jgi:hypothetical protein
MRKKFVHLMLTSVLVLAVAAPSVLAQAGGAMGQSSKPARQKEHAMHPSIHKAIRQLQEAKETLKDAPNDFHGYKNNALKSIDEAIGQLRQAAQVQQK